MIGKQLIGIQMPEPDRHTRNVFKREIERERAYDSTSLQQQVETNGQLTKAADNGNSGPFFPDEPVGILEDFRAIKSSG